MELQEQLLACARTHCFPAAEALTIQEISEGNINHIYRVENPADGTSVILKHAQVQSRISAQICLNPDRGRREAAYLRRLSGCLGAALPQVYAYDETLHLILMQDLKDCTLLRSAMIAKHCPAGLGARLGALVADACLETSDFCLPHAEKKTLQASFSNPELCALTEDLVFTHPFTGAKDNSVCAENTEFVAASLEQNEPLRTQAAALKLRFMNAPQALIHGDLHFGSVFLTQQDRPVFFDPEFCFFGPIGFDLGNLFAHFLLEYLFAQFNTQTHGAAFAERLKKEMCAFVRSFETRFFACAQQRCTDPMLSGAETIAAFVSSVLADAAGFAGVECLRRTVGIAKNPEFDLLPQAQRVEMERAAMETGMRLIVNGKTMRSAAAFAQFIETMERRQ